MKREFLQQPIHYCEDKHNVAGWYFCEKPDGVRCYWDGGISRNKKTSKVPWASLKNPKTGQPKSKIRQYATGLWSQYGNPLPAPDSFLDRLPPFPLDGYLWLGRGKYTEIRNLCMLEKVTEQEYKGVQFAAISSPGYGGFLTGGTIKNDNMDVTIHTHRCTSWINQQVDQIISVPANSNLDQELFAMSENDQWDDEIYILLHTILPTQERVAKETVHSLETTLRMNNSRGFFIRNPFAVWKPKKVDSFLQRDFTKE